MHIHFSLLIGGMLAMSGVASAQTSSSSTGTESNFIGDPGYADSFQCPETYPDYPSQRAATTAFLKWARESHPEWRVEQTLNYRTALMQAYQCNQTLDDMVTNSPK